MRAGDTETRKKDSPRAGRKRSAHVRTDRAALRDQV
jgi:hypothetical protein